MMNPEQESPSREPWAQIPRMPGHRREPGVAYEAFQGYYRLPPDERSARLTALKLGKFKTVCFDFAALRSRTFIVQRLPVSDRCSFDEIARLRFKSLLRLYDSFSGRTMQTSKMLRYFPRWYDPRGGRDQAVSAGRSAAFTSHSGRNQL